MSAPLSYNVEGAAKAVGVSRRTIWRAIHDGKLSTFKLGARTLIEADALKAFLDREKAASQAA